MRQQLAIAVLALTLGLPARLTAAAGNSVDPEPAPAAGDVESITITGQRPSLIRRQMMDFVVEIGDPVGGSFGRGFARWRKKVCVGIHNLTDTSAAQYVADRISGIAAELGLEPGEPGCEPNLNVIFSSDGRAMATQLAEYSPRIFRPYGGEGGTTQGRQALEEFKTTEAAVRWWQITMIVDELGYAAIDISNGVYGPPLVRSGGPSLLKTATSDDIWFSYAIVDANKLNGAQLPQLADYLAMVSLAQIDPNALPSSDSILNLFTAASPAAGLTDMDRTYLRALYDIDTMMLPQMQRGMLANRMMRAKVYGEE